MSVHRVKPVRCALCGSNLAELNLSVHSLVSPYVADVATVDCVMFNKRHIIIIFGMLVPLDAA